MIEDIVEDFFLDSILENIYTRISEKDISDTLSDFGTRESPWSKIDFLIIPKRCIIEGKSWTNKENLRESTSDIATLIPFFHIWCDIRSKYLWYIIAIFLSQIPCLCKSRRIYLPREEYRINLDSIPEIFGGEFEKSQSMIIRDISIVFIFSFPSRDDEDFLRDRSEESSDDTIMTDVIEVWRIECSPIHDEFVWYHRKKY